MGETGPHPLAPNPLRAGQTDLSTFRKSSLPNLTLGSFRTLTITPPLAPPPRTRQLRRERQPPLSRRASLAIPRFIRAHTRRVHRTYPGPLRSPLARTHTTRAAESSRTEVRAHAEQSCFPVHNNKDHSSPIYARTYTHITHRRRHRHRRRRSR